MTIHSDIQEVISRVIEANAYADIISPTFVATKVLEHYDVQQMTRSARARIEHAAALRSYRDQRAMEIQAANIG
jgi:hypothetical protein